MKPRLYEAGTQHFTDNGFGSLIDAVECYTKQAFGALVLEMKYPVTGRLFKELTDQRIILAETEPLKPPQPFYIYRITKPMDGIVTVYGKHVCYQLDGHPVRPFTATTAPEAMEKLKSNAMTEHPFTFESDVGQEGSFAFKKPTEAWKLLGGAEGSILDVFHGEYEFDHYTVRLLSRRGADRGVSLRYGKNLRSLEQDANCAGCYTGIVAYWVDAQTGDTIYTEPVLAEGNFGYSRTLTVDFTDKFETRPTLAQLTERAGQYIKDNDIGVPTVSIKVQFVPLNQTEELGHLALLERVQFGDTVHTYFPEMDIDVSARVVETCYDSLHGRYKDVTIGKAKHSLAELIVNQQKQIDKIPQGTALQIAMAQATAAITGARGGAVRLLDLDGDGMPDTIYVADKADPGQAQHVWRWNWAGWGYSANGFDGPFKLAATLDGGIVADFITTGNLNASLLTAGTLNAKLVKVINLSAESITTGKLSVDRLDVDNLVVKALRAAKRDESGFVGIVEADTGAVRLISNDGSVDRTVMEMYATAMPSNFATTWPIMYMNRYKEGVLDAKVTLNPVTFGMESIPNDNRPNAGSFRAMMGGDGLYTLFLDNLECNSNGQMTWEYVEAIGKKVLTRTA